MVREGDVKDWKEKGERRGWGAKCGSVIIMAHGDEVEHVMPSVLRWLIDWCMLCNE